jgi:hypothetical protein
VAPSCHAILPYAYTLLRTTNKSNPRRRIFKWKWKRRETNLDVDEKSFCTTVQTEVNLDRLHQKEEKEMMKLFHIKNQIKKNKVDALFNSDSQPTSLQRT